MNVWSFMGFSCSFILLFLLIINRFQSSITCFFKEKIDNRDYIFVLIITLLGIYDGHYFKLLVNNYDLIK